MNYEIDLGDVAEIIMGQSPSGETCNGVGVGIALLNGPTEFGLSYPIAKQFTSDPKKICKKSDLLFCVRGSTTGRMNWADKEYAIGRGLAAIRGKNGYSTVFVRAVIEERLRFLLAQATGSTFPNVSGEQLKTLKTPFVNAVDAEKIGFIFDTIEKRTKLLRETNKTLEAIAQAIFKSWFVDFDPVHAKQLGIECAGIDKATADLFPSSFVQSELGLIPEGWHVGAVGDLVMQDKKTINPAVYKDTVFDHYSLPAFDIDKMPSKDIGTDIKSNKTIVQASSTLVSKLNPKTPRVWLPACVNDNAVCSTEFIPFSPNTLSGATKHFVFCLLNDSALLNALSQKVTGTSSSHQRIRPSDITETSFVLPDPAVITTFSKLIEPLLNKIGKNRLLIKELDCIKNTLLPRLMSGKLNLSEIEEQLEGVA
jgi:type I restriction enzyme S subunit